MAGGIPWRRSQGFLATRDRDPASVHTPGQEQIEHAIGRCYRLGDGSIALVGIEGFDPPTQEGDVRDAELSNHSLLKGNSA